MQRRVQSGKLRQCTFRRAFEKRYLRLRIRINAFSGVSCCARCRTCAEAGSCCRSGRFGTLRSDCQARGKLSQPDQTLDRFWDLPQRDLLELLEATAVGLTSAEAKQRLHLHGPNSLARESRFAPLIAFLRFFANPLSSFF
jgi:magnesium-transporting ATPase (P-type)